MSRSMREVPLSHRRIAKGQGSLRIRAVSPEPSLFAHTMYESRGSKASDRAGDLPHWVGAHARMMDH